MGHSGLFSLKSRVAQLFETADVVNLVKSHPLHDTGGLATAVARAAVQIVGFILVEFPDFVPEIGCHKIDQVIRLDQMALVVLTFGTYINDDSPLLFNHLFKLIDTDVNS